MLRNQEKNSIGQNFKKVATERCSSISPPLGPLMRFLKENAPPEQSVSQVQDLQVLLHDIHAEGMTLSETFQVAAIIEKLPPSLEGQQAGFRKDSYTPDSARAIMVVHAGPSFKVNLVGLTTVVGLIGYWGTRHVCADKSMFHSFRAVDNGEKLYMGNSATADIKGEGDVILKMTSEKELKLTNVFESDKFVLLSIQCHGGKGYAVDAIKDEAIDKFVLYKTEVENQLGKKIKVVRSDRGGEYVAPFAEFCAKHGIRHEFTAPYSPQQNGIAERKNRTLKEMVTAMLISSLSIEPGHWNWEPSSRLDDKVLRDKRQEMIMISKLATSLTDEEE
ncbi:retrotransposon protein, putative, ty1-copia subclass [Tanacetum coccineum]